MSHFYGTLTGNRGTATRCGSLDSGITTHAASWEGAVRVTVWFNEAEDCDWATVALTPWHGRGRDRVLYSGPVSGAPVPDGCFEHGRVPEAEGVGIRRPEPESVRMRWPEGLPA